MSLSNDNDDDNENVAKKIELVSFQTISRLFWPGQFCQMWAIFPGVEFLRNLSLFKKRKENSSSYVHVLHKTSH